MSHKAEIIHKKRASNGAIAVRIRCCGDPSTDSMATLHIRPGTDVAAFKAREIARVEAEHEAMLQAEKELESL